VPCSGLTNPAHVVLLTVYHAVVHCLSEQRPTDRQIVVTGAVVAAVLVLVARVTNTDIRTDCVVATFAVRLTNLALRISVTTLVDICNINVQNSSLYTC